MFSPAAPVCDPMPQRKRASRRGAREDREPSPGARAAEQVTRDSANGQSARRVFVDLDGTLADFAGSVRGLGQDVNGDTTAMWDAIAGAPKFWRAMPWLPDGEALWKALEPLRPAVLTGLPDHSSLRKRAEDQKRAWCREHLGPSVEVICVASRDKGMYSGPGQILVDDDERHREPWQRGGGHFVARADVASTMRAVERALVSGGEVVAPTMGAQLSLALQKMQLTPPERALRAQVAVSVRRCVEAAGGGRFEAALVGSMGAGLASGSSDLDFALVPASGVDGPLPELALEGLAKELESRGGMRDVQVVRTRSKAPDVIKCVHEASGLPCDLVVHSEGLGSSANVAKCALLCHFGSASAHFRPLALLVKHWAKSRHLVDPAGRKLNSFTFTLMVAFFLEVNGLMSIPDLRPEALMSKLAAAQECSAGPTLPTLLRGFFSYWRQFDFTGSCAFLPCGCCRSIESIELQPYETPPAFVVIDPIEPDENTARTLGRRNLEELRTELNRACVLTEQGQSWEEVCTPPAAKKVKELKQFLLPPLTSADTYVVRGGQWGDGEASPGNAPPPWTEADRERLRAMVESSVHGASLQAPVAVVEQHARLHTVRLLRQGMSLEALQARYKLFVKRHPRLDVVQLSYSQTESPMASPVVQECRGLILQLGTWNVVSMPFAKFFNYGESNARALDWAGGVQVREKLDGSIMSLYWYQGHWHVASNKLPAGDGLVPDGGTKTFAEAFWDTWREKGYRLPSNTGACFMFEMLLPSHTIVVRHGNADLLCIGGRELGGLTEFPCEEAGRANGWATPKRFNELRDLDSVLAAARLLNPVAQEGFVVVDRHWCRLKIKCAGYVALHHLSSCPGWRTAASAAGLKARHRSLLQIARNNEGDEFLAYFPELEEEFRNICNTLMGVRRYLRGGAHAGRAGAGVHALAHLSRRMHRGDCTAQQLLREVKIQDLEGAVEAFRDLPPEVIAELTGGDVPDEVTEHVDVANPDSAKAVGPRLEVRDGEGSEDGRESPPTVMPRPTLNRFAVFDDDSESDSESDG